MSQWQPVVIVKGTLGEKKQETPCLHVESYNLEFEEVEYLFVFFFPRMGCKFVVMLKQIWDVI